MLDLQAIPQSDGKVIVVGSFSYIGNVERAGIARLNADGTLDPTFDAGTGANGAINLVAAQSDGKVLIVGPFTSVNGTTRNGVARLDSDGKLDSTFNPGAGISSPSKRRDLRPPDGFWRQSGLSRRIRLLQQCDAAYDRAAELGRLSRSHLRRRQEPHTA